MEGRQIPNLDVPAELLCLWLLASGVIVARRLDWRAD